MGERRQEVKAWGLWRERVIGEEEEITLEAQVDEEKKVWRGDRVGGKVVDGEGGERLEEWENGRHHVVGAPPHVLLYQFIVFLGFHKNRIQKYK